MFLSSCLYLQRRIRCVLSLMLTTTPSAPQRRPTDTDVSIVADCIWYLWFFRQLGLLQPLRHFILECHGGSCKPRLAHEGLETTSAKGENGRRRDMERGWGHGLVLEYGHGEQRSYHHGSTILPLPTCPRRRARRGQGLDAVVHGERHNISGAPLLSLLPQ
ncbi:hypothetical protein GALMADRAFT_561397, partial [Galerina marginata CBS 339.88]